MSVAKDTTKYLFLVSRLRTGKIYHQNYTGRLKHRTLLNKGNIFADFLQLPISLNFTTHS